MVDDEDALDAPGLVKTLADGLWFPMLFLVGFLLCYLLPFHDPAPHDLSVAVSDPATAAAVASALDAGAPGAFDITSADDDDAVRSQVLDRSVIAGFSVAGGEATLYTAGADGIFLEQAVSTTFSSIADAQQLSLTTVDLVPSAPGDTSGTGLFYLALIWNLIPYITVMMLLRAALGKLGRLVALAATGAVVTVVSYLFGLALEVVPSEPRVMLYAYLTFLAVGLVTSGLAPFVGQFLPGVAITLFVLLSIPSSGGAIPWQLVPGFFRFLHPVLPLGNTIDAARGVAYFDDQGLLRPTMVLLAWIAAGVLLTVAGLVRERRREATQGEASAGRPVEDPTVQLPVPHAVDPSDRGAIGARVIGGTVRNSEGQPVERAMVTLLSPGGQQLTGMRTDGLGRYIAAGLPAGENVIVVLLAQHYAPAAAQVMPHAGKPIRQDFDLMSV